MPSSNPFATGNGGEFRGNPFAAPTTDQDETAAFRQWQTTKQKAMPAATAPTMVDELARQASLTGRAAFNFAAGVPLAVGDVANKALNLLPGVNLAMPSEEANKLLTKAGAVEPANWAESLTQDVARTLSPQAAAETVAARALPLASKAKQAITAGAATGAATAPEDQTATGTVIGGAASALPFALGKVISGIKPSAAAQTLMAEGIQPSIGQSVGGRGLPGRVVSQVESALSPLTGEARTRGVQQFNQAAITRALKPLGIDLAESADMSARDLLDIAKSKLGDKYNEVLGKVQAVPVSQTLTNINNHAQAAMMNIEKNSLVPESAWGQAQNYVARRIAPLQGKTGKLSGQDLKAIDAELAQQIRSVSSSPDLEIQKTAPAWQSIRDGLQATIETNADKATAAELRSVNAAWRQLVPVEQAIPYGGTGFTPRQLAAAQERNLGKVSEFTRAAQEVLPDKMPSSGTSERQLIQSLATGGGLGFGAASLGLGAANPLLVGLPIVSTKAGTRAALGQTGAQKAVAEALRAGAKTKAARQMGAAAISPALLKFLRGEKE